MLVIPIAQAPVGNFLSAGASKAVQATGVQL